MIPLAVPEYKVVGIGVIVVLVAFLIALVDHRRQGRNRDDSTSAKGNGKKH